MKHILVTGASGFVGNNLVRFLLEEGHEVHLLLRPKYTSWRLKDVFSDVRIHLVDLLDNEGVSRVVRTIRPEWVFHLAAYGAYSSQTDVRTILQTNIIGTANLVEACLKTGFETFVNTGSSSEYGFKDHSPSETEWVDPNSYYAVTKASATLFCRYAAQREDVHIVTLRLYSVYGPYEEPTRLLPTLILKGLEKRFPPLVDPNTARDYVYVNDVIRAYMLAATIKGQEPGAVYNVGTGIQITLRQVINVVRSILDIRTEPQWGSMKGRIWDTNIWVADNRYAQSVLNWFPQYNFETGFCKMLDWFRNTPGILEMYRAKCKPE
jgi:nucleoside-diphosphate-sugar epimerase